MTTSSFCQEYRQKQQEKTQKLLIWGISGSLVIHSAIAVALVTLAENPTIAEEDPIELIIVEQPEPSKPQITPKEEPLKPKPSPITKVKPTPLPLKPLPQPEPSPVTQQKPLPSPVKPSPVAKISPIPQKGTPVQPESPELQISPIAEPIEPIISPTTLANATPPKPVFSQPQPTEPISEAEPVPTSVNTPTVSASRPTKPTTAPRTLTASSPRKPVFNAPSSSSSAAPPSDDGLPTSLANAPAVSSSRPPVVRGSSQPLANNSQNRGGLRNSLSNSSAAKPTTGQSTAPSAISTNPVATNRVAPKPNPKAPVSESGLSCISNCQPSYPSVLQGAEGKATVQVIVDKGGNVVSVSLANPNPNSGVNQQALLAARNMKFSSPASGGQASVNVTINFTVAGSEFDRQARERREQQERARQAELDKKRQEQQAQLERERQERQRKLEQERQERERQLRSTQQSPKPPAIETPLVPLDEPSTP